MADLTGAIWRKSTRSGNGNNCVEVATNVEPGVLVRDSKDPAGAVLGFARSDWTAFTVGLHQGQFNLRG